jgi:tetraacyldisaccharide 4'-kinase
MSILKLLLIPFAMIYDLIMNVRNRLYDQSFKPSASFDLPVIGVGNLAVGGTGKTPMVEYLIRLLGSTHAVVTLSRGYGRKTKGFRLAGSADTARTIGDEPFQLYSKYKEQIHVAVGEERALAIPMIMDELPDTGIIVMDDSFQHRRVKPGFQILLTAYDRPFYGDHVLPYGRLREGPEGADRADVIVMTKCPDHLSEEEMMHREREVQQYSHKPLFFSHIRYGEPRPFAQTQEKFSQQVVLVSGIAQSHVLAAYVRKQFTLVRHFDFRDHHHYSIGDLQEIGEVVRQATGPVSILVTEKDRTKLEIPEFAALMARMPFFYLPIEMEFLRNGKDFDTLVTAFVETFHRE